MAESAESPAPRRQPKSVQDAVALLRLQGIIWALLCAGIVAGGSASLATTSKVTTTAVVAAVTLALASGSFAVAKLRLAHRLPRGTHETREAAITVETLMACFAGLVVFGLTVSGMGLIISPPFIIGGIMSARVAGGLGKPPAMRYFDANEAVDAGRASPPSVEGGSSVPFQGRLAMA